MGSAETSRHTASTSASNGRGAAADVLTVRWSFLMVKPPCSLRPWPVHSCLHPNGCSPLYHAYNITILLRCQRFFLTFYRSFFNSVTFLCHLLHGPSKSPVDIAQKRVHVGTVRGDIGAESHRLVGIIHPLPERKRIPGGQTPCRLIGQDGKNLVSGRIAK